MQLGVEPPRELRSVSEGILRRFAEVGRHKDAVQVNHRSSWSVVRRVGRRRRPTTPRWWASSVGPPHGLLSRQLMEAFAQLPGDGTGLTVADESAVALDYWHHFGGGAGQETFVGAVDVVTSQGHFLHRDLGFAGQAEDGVARHAFEDAGDQVRRAQDAVLDEEEVVASAFGDLAVVIE